MKIYPDNSAPWYVHLSYGFLITLVLLLSLVFVVWLIEIVKVEFLIVLFISMVVGSITILMNYFTEIR